MMDITYESLSDGRYKLVSELGAGGMATVWRAFDERLRVDRAIKILSPHLVRNATIRRRFENEARTMARLHHPNIVTVHDVVLDDEAVYIVMELVEGGSLLDALQRHGIMDARRASAVTRAVLSALTAAHSAGVIHRDIKPHNVLLDRHGTPKLTDFGIAQVMDHKQLTRTGSAMGTLGFMAPEQQDDARGVDVRADIYAVGATLYALVTGRNPVNLFAYDRDPTIMQGVPEEVVPIICKACSYSPGDRYEDAATMSRAMGTILGDALTDEPSIFEDLVPPSLRSEASGVRQPIESPDNATIVPGGLDPVALPAVSTAPETWTGPDPDVGETIFEDPQRSRAWMAIPLLLLLLGGGWMLLGGESTEVSTTPAVAEPTPPVADVAPPEPEVVEDEVVEDEVVEDEAEDEEPEVVEAVEPPVEDTPVVVTEPATPPEELPAEDASVEEEAQRNAMVSLTGDATEVWLFRGAILAQLPGEIPPGPYEVRASFGGELRGAGKVHVPEFGSLTVDCISAFKQCKAR